MAITGDVLTLIQAANGNVLAGTSDAAKIFRSTDSGITFSLLTTIGAGSDRVNAITKDFSGNLYAAVTGTASGGIWKSTNHGANWTRVKTHSRGVSFGYFDIAYLRVSNLLVAVGHGILLFPNNNVIVSRDAGVTWTDTTWAHSTVTMYAAAAYPDAMLTTTYPGEQQPLGPEVFVAGDQDYTEAGRVGWQGNNAPFAQQVSAPAMGGVGLDMASFTITDAQQQPRRLALWSTTARSVPTTTEIYRWPASPTGPYVFARIASIPNERFNALYPDPVQSHDRTVRTIWAGANGKIFVSYNSGLTWALATDVPTNNIYSFVRTTSGLLVAGGANGEIFIFGLGGSEGGGPGGGDEDEDEDEDPDVPPVVPESPPAATTRELGRTATTANEVYVANKFAFSNVTHIFHYNGSTYDNLQFEDVPPFDILGTSPTDNKAIYFGSRTTDTNVPGGTFSSLVFDITQKSANITVVWEYWNGSSWAALTVQDGTDGFRILGVNSVHWLVPTNWATTSVNSVTGYWVRARVSTGTGTRVGPIHDNRYIYTSLLPCIDIAAGQIFGDLPAISRVNWTNRGDDIGSAVNLQIDRLVCGLKSLDRGTNFNAYLNISDVQPLFGVTVSKDSGSTWQNSVKAPTGRSLTTSYSSGGDLNVWKNLVTFSLSTSVARDFYGHYRPFLRCYKVGATALDWQVRLKVVFGSGGGSKEGTPVFPSAQNDWEVLDLREVAIPTTQVSNQTGNLGDQLQITIQGKCSALSSQLILYDLILVPTDEWAVDTKPPELSTLIPSEVRGTYYMDIDSITNPKAMLVALNRNSADQIISRYQAIGNGPAILQTGRDQRIWFLAMSYENFWRGYPEIAGTVQVFKKQRYLGLRGTT